MCWRLYISARELSSGWDSGLVKLGLEAKPPSEVVLPEILREQCVFEVSRGGCACDLLGGSPESDRARLLKKYRRKGWSLAKIERAIKASGQSRGGVSLKLREDFWAWFAGLVGDMRTVWVFAGWMNAAKPAEAGQAQVRIQEVLPLGEGLKDGLWNEVSSGTDVGASSEDRS